MTELNIDSGTADWISRAWSEAQATRDRLYDAIHVLHEQAHGDVPYRTCSEYPCRELHLPIVGPARRTL